MDNRYETEEYPAPSHEEIRANRMLSAMASTGRQPLTLRNLFSYNTRYNPLRARRSLLCSIRAVQRGVTGRGNPAYTLVILDNQEGTGRPHRVDISSADEKEPAYTGRPVVSCTCEDFVFRCEYALTQWKVSVIRYGNGDPAGIKNLMNAPYVCKHILCAMQHLFNRSR